MAIETREFGKYTLLARVGKGGVGSVYRARDGETEDIVAVKVFECTPERPLDVTRRLRNREVRMLLSVQHPNIVQFRETGEVGEDHYYTMEFVEHSLLERMRYHDSMQLVDKVHLLRQTASALAAVHHQAIVHRDVKPGNILLGVEPGGALHAKLTDLGIAINVSETDIIQEQRRGAIPGTPKYMSPEQVRKEHLDGRSDIFGLGVVAYELLSGTLPFTADTADEYMAANAEQTPRPLIDLMPDFPLFLSQMVDHMLARDREERYDSDTLARDLQLVEQHLVSGAPLVERTNGSSLFYEPDAAPPSRRRLPRIAPVSYALVAAIVLAGVAAGWFLQPGKVQAAAPAALPAAADGPAALMQEARSSAAAGHNWRAMLILQQIDRAGLSGDDARAYDNLAGIVRDALAKQDYATADSMLKDGRQAEAEVVLMHMKDAYPESDQTAKLGAEIAARRQHATDAQRFERAMAHTYDLVGRRQYADALAERRKLLQDFAGDPKREEQARRSIGDLFNGWGRYLEQSNPGIDRLEEFFSALDQSGPVAPPEDLADVVAALRVRLGRRYQAASDFAKALEQFDLASKEGGADTRATARGLYDQLNTRMMQQPVDAAAFAKEVADKGLGAASWQAHADPRGHETIAAGVLTMRIDAGEGACAVTRRTMRPLRNLGFDVAVQFQPTKLVGGARAGIGVADVEGSGYQLYFDGSGYSLSQRSRGSSLSSRLGPALGDEATAWHTLRMRYVFDTGRLTILLDDKVLDEQSADLSDFRISLFLDTQSTAAASAQVPQLHLHALRRGPVLVPKFRNVPALCSLGRCVSRRETRT